MQLSRGARRCLKELQRFCGGKDHCWPKRETIAKRLGVSLRSVAYYLAELEAKSCTSVRRRPNSSAVYTLRGKIALPVALPDCTPFYRTEYKSIERKPAQREQRTTMPPEEVRNEYGRLIPNPAFERIQNALRQARGRIGRANDPAAYERAIIEREMRSA